MDQFDKQLVTALKSLQDDPDFGASLDFEGIHQRAMLRNGFDTSTEKETYSGRDYLETYLWMFTHSLLKPMAAGVAVFLFAVVGSVSILGASAQALPGEKLYPVKVGVEKAQLALALNSQQRANLRVEFASRRLEEMVEVSAMLDHGTSQSVQLAANRFKDEVANIQEELRVEDGTDSQKEFAKTVGRKVDVYSSTVATTSLDLPDDVRGEVESILEETKDQAVDVIITAHEAEQDEESAADLDAALAAEMASVEATYGEEAGEAISTAEALRAEGLYRRAFQVLKDFIFEAELVP